MPQRKHPRSIGLLWAVGLTSAIGLLWAAGLPWALAAESPGGMTFDLDPQATHVTFTLGATMHTVHGTLRARRGSLRFDPASGAAAGEIVLDAQSAETGNGSRDRDMHGKILESGRYPEIVWKIDRVEGFPPAGTRSAKVTLSGNLTVHGATHALTAPAQVTLAGDHRATANVTFEIPYVAWGMKDPSSFVLRVDKVVAVEVQAAGRLGG
jgi:polyisoprenoid-binding protein YceI